MSQGPCYTCGNESKYKCPKCFKTSCSVDCVRKHKSSTGCTGELDPTAFLAKPDLFTTVALDRDYNFLQSIGRKIMLDKNDARANRVVKPRNMWRAGVHVHPVARGMSRNRKNRSRWDNQGKQFEWTVEIRHEKEVQYVQVGDKTLVGSLPALYNAPTDHHVVLRDAHGERHLLDKSSTLQDAIRGKNVLEFPTIEFLPAENKVAASDSSDSSDVSSDSSSDDSDADSDVSADTNAEANPVKADAQNGPVVTQGPGGTQGLESAQGPRGPEAVNNDPATSEDRILHVNDARRDFSVDADLSSLPQEKTTNVEQSVEGQRPVSSGSREHSDTDSAPEEEPAKLA